MPKVLKDTDKLSITKLSDNKYHKRYVLTKKQRDIFKSLDIALDNYDNYINEIKTLLNKN